MTAVFDALIWSLGITLKSNDLWKALCGHVKEHCPFTGQVTQELCLSHFPVCLNGPNANDRFDWARVTLVRFL